jgi:DNA-binding transcriptional regulator YhcF (GntR family)
MLEKPLKILKYPKRRNEIVTVLSAEFARLPSGSRLPGTVELCKRFKCASMTINRALGELEVRGEIFRVQGKGTFIPNRELKNIYVLAPAPSGRWPKGNNLYEAILQYSREKGIAVHIIYATTNNVP